MPARAGAIRVGRLRACRHDTWRTLANGEPLVRGRAELADFDQAAAASETLRVNRAWATLRDPEKRRRYDEQLRQQTLPVMPRQSAGDRWRPTRARPRPRPDYERRQGHDHAGFGSRQDAGPRPWCRRRGVTPYTTFAVAQFLLTLLAVVCAVVGVVLLAGMTR